MIHIIKIYNINNFYSHHLTLITRVSKSYKEVMRKTHVSFDKEKKNLNFDLYEKTIK